MELTDPPAPPIRYTPEISEYAASMNELSYALIGIGIGLTIVGVISAIAVGILTAAPVIIPAYIISAMTISYPLLCLVGVNLVIAGIYLLIKTAAEEKERHLQKKEEPTFLERERSRNLEREQRIAQQQEREKRERAALLGPRQAQREQLATAALARQANGQAT